MRQRLSELGLGYVARQVPVEREDRTELLHRTGQQAIPVLVVDDHVHCGSEAILSYLNTPFTESAEAARQRAKAAAAQRKELEKACPELPAVTH